MNVISCSFHHPLLSSIILLSLSTPASPLSQFNSAARQLIESDKQSDSSGDSGEGASLGPQSNGAQRAGEKKNSKKRHSFTSLTMSHKPMLAPPPQRHSMEISGPVLISSSNPTAAARIGEISGGLSSSAPSQVRLFTRSCAVCFKAAALSLLAENRKPVLTHGFKPTNLLTPTLIHFSV